MAMKERNDNDSTNGNPHINYGGCGDDSVADKVKHAATAQNIFIRRHELRLQKVMQYQKHMKLQNNIMIEMWCR